MSKPQIPDDIPHDVTLDILPNLPVKTLVRFKCVSKLWHTVISDPEFTKMHYKLLCRDLKKSTPKILVSTPSHVQFLDYEEAVSAAEEKTFGDECAFVKLDFPSKRPDSVVKIVGSCHGLVCVALEACKDFFVWNPSTGDSKRLPDPGIIPCGDYYSHGFGYDVLSDDYKVFVAGQIEGSCKGIEVGIFSLKKGCWKKIQKPFGLINHLIHSDDSLGVLLNGFLHWKAKWSESGGEFDEIFAFSLADEKVREIPLPDTAEHVYCNTLGVLGCRLLTLTCLVCEDNVSAAIELWIMKDYGVSQSWFKSCRISSPIDYNYNLVPLCVTRDKGIIMNNDGKELIKYYPKKRKLEHLKICGGDQNECEVTVYVETLLSPNVDNRN